MSSEIQTVAVIVQTNHGLTYSVVLPKLPLPKKKQLAEARDGRGSKLATERIKAIQSAEHECAGA